MNAASEIEILLVEDSPYDAELTIRELSRRNLANKLVHLKDGAEALDFIFGTGAYADRDISQHPKVVLLDLKLPKVDGLQVLRTIKSDPRWKAWRQSDFCLWLNSLGDAKSAVYCQSLPNVLKRSRHTGRVGPVELATSSAAFAEDKSPLLL